MVKRVCDRCGEDVSAYYNMRIIRGTSVVVTEICDYDLCDDCWDDFMEFMEQKLQLRNGRRSK